MECCRTLPPVKEENVLGYPLTHEIMIDGPSKLIGILTQSVDSAVLKRKFYPGEADLIRV